MEFARNFFSRHGRLVAQWVGVLEADEVDSDTALTSSEALVGGALVAIIVAPIAAVLVIVAVIVAIVCCCRKKKEEEKARATGSADVASVEIKTSV